MRFLGFDRHDTSRRKAAVAARETTIAALRVEAAARRDAVRFNSHLGHVPELA
jgi:hypothetical protein